MTPIAGEYYQVEFKIIGKRRNRVMIAQFIGRSAIHSYWSLRPIAGTQNLRLCDVVRIHKTPMKRPTLPSIVLKDK